MNIQRKLSRYWNVMNSQVQMISLIHFPVLTACHIPKTSLREWRKMHFGKMILRDMNIIHSKCA